MKLPRFQQRTSIGLPGGLRPVRIPRGGGTGQQVSRAIEGFGLTVGRVADALAALELQKIDREMVERVAQFEIGVGQIELSHREVGDPDEYAALMVRDIRTLGDTVVQQAPNEVLRARLGDKIGLKIGEAENAVGFEVAKRKTEQEIAKLSEMGEFYSRLVAEADTEVKQADLAAEFLQLVDAAEQRRVIFPEPAQVLRQNFKEGIAEVQVLKHISLDPFGAEVDIADGKYSDLDPKREQELLRSAQTAGRTQRAEEERETKLLQEANFSDILNRMANREDVFADLLRMGPSGTREISVEQQLLGLKLNMVARETIDRPSDPGTLERVSLDVHSTNPTTSEGDIDRLVTDQTLNLKQGLALKDRLVTNREKMKSNPDLTRRHAQAEQILMNGLTTRSPFEALDPVSQKLKTQALLELTLRSSLFDGKEDPLTVAREILPHLQKAFEDEAKLEEETIRKVLLYPTPQALEAARHSMPVGTYESQRKLFMDLDKRIQERIAIEGQRKETGSRGGPFRP